MTSVADELQSLREQIADASNTDPASTRPLLEQLWQLRPGASSASFVNQHHAALGDLTKKSITVLRSFTVEPLVPILRAAASLHGLDLTIDVGGFGTYAQDLLDPSSAIYTTSRPDVAILAVQARDVAPDLWDSFSRLDSADVDLAVARVAGEFSSMIDAFRRHGDADLIVHSLEVPGNLALGVADRSAERGQAQAFDELNARIADAVDRTSGVHLLDVNQVISDVGRPNWHDDRKWTSMRMPIRADAMPILVDAWLRLIVPVTGQVSKALVVDLDNTLWGGVIGEDGVEGIDLGPDAPIGAGFLALQRTLLDLRARGIILAICSKNNHDDVVEVLDQHPHMVVKLEHFSAVRANWEPKPDNLRSIADELNIGLDSIAFIDDNPAECDQVRRLLSDVTVIELRSPPTPSQNPLARHPRFERTALTGEDRSRADMYEQQRQRRQLETSSVSLEDHLNALGTTVTTDAMGHDDVPRISQLTQKTNQFNLTTNRYTESQIESFGAEANATVLAVRAADRFGDHGLIGTAIVRASASTATIDTLLLSCRVIGRGVETAILAWIVDWAAARGCTDLVGDFVPTARNKPAAGLYESNGFERVHESSESSTWRLEVGPEAIVVPSWISWSLEHEEQDT